MVAPGDGTDTIKGLYKPRFDLFTKVRVSFRGQLSITQVIGIAQIIPLIWYPE